MKFKILITLAFVGFAFKGLAQDDLLNMLNTENKLKPVPVYATFKSTRLVNLHTNEVMKAKHLDFRIQHRFAALNGGPYELFGLDGAKIRFSLEYGITNRLMVGVGRSAFQKTYDGFAKYQLFQQKTSGLPMSIVLFTSTALNTLSWDDPSRNNYFSSRMSFCFQTIFTSKINDYVSVMLAPTMVHYNLVPTTETPNDIYALGIGTSIKITRSTKFTLEYIPRLNGRDFPKVANGDPSYYDAIAFGFDIETGGHVFQLHFTNSQGVIEQQFVGRNANPMKLSELRFGFNISRTFSFDKSPEKKW